MELPTAGLSPFTPFESISSTFIAFRQTSRQDDEQEALPTLRTPLANNGHEGVAALLLGRGQERGREETPPTGLTPLSWAAIHDHSGVIALY